MRSSLKKSWLEDFYQFCESLGRGVVFYCFFLMVSIIFYCFLRFFRSLCFLFLFYVLILEGSTARIMRHILNTEADFRVLSVTLNTINSPLSSSSRLLDRNSLLPSFGYLYPEGTDRIRKAWNDVTVRAALEPFPVG